MMRIAFHAEKKMTVCSKACDVKSVLKKSRNSERTP